MKTSFPKLVAWITALGLVSSAAASAFSATKGGGVQVYPADTYVQGGVRLSTRATVRETPKGYRVVAHTQQLEKHPDSPRTGSISMITFDTTRAGVPRRVRLVDPVTGEKRWTTFSGNSVARLLLTKRVPGGGAALQAIDRLHDSLKSRP